MFAYQAPNVYFELRDEHDRSLTPLRTDIVGFVGIAARGPVHTAVKIESWTQFTTIFGQQIPQAYLAYAVEGFFANGGQTCYVVRVVDPATAQKANFLLRENCDDGQSLAVSDNEQIFQITSRFPGVLAVSVVQGGNGRFTLTLKAEDGYQEVWRNLSTDKEDPRYIVNVLSPDDTVSDPETEAVPPPPCLAQDAMLEAVEIDPAEESIAAAIRSRSVLVKVKHIELVKTFTERKQQTKCIQQMECMAFGDSRLRRFGQAGLKDLAKAHFGDEERPLQKWGLQQFEDIDEISLIAMPDIMPKPVTLTETRMPAVRCHDLTAVPTRTSAQPYRPEYPPAFARQEIHLLQRAMLRHCAKLKDRIAILDSWQADLSPNDIVAWRTPENAKSQFLAADDGAFYGAFYYPWIKVPDPLRIKDVVRAIPPSGYVAGMMARVDNRSGVHKPPANELLLAAKDVTQAVADQDYGRLNKLGVNLIRCYPGRGIRVAGARTLLRRQDSWWHERGYINVRRLLIMIMESIESQLQWTVFEANNPLLWQQIERVIRTFLNRLWQHGMLDGATAEDAFTVLCNRETNPPYEIDQGRVICHIRLRPPWPAEFVIVRIGVTDGEIELLE